MLVTSEDRQNPQRSLYLGAGSAVMQALFRHYIDQPVYVLWATQDMLEGEVSQPAWKHRGIPQAYPTLMPENEWMMVGDGRFDWKIFYGSTSAGRSRRMLLKIPFIDNQQQCNSTSERVKIGRKYKLKPLRLERNEICRMGIGMQNQPKTKIITFDQFT